MMKSSIAAFHNIAIGLIVLTSLTSAEFTTARLKDFFGLSGTDECPRADGPFQFPVNQYYTVPTHAAEDRGRQHRFGLSQYYPLPSQSMRSIAGPSRFGAFTEGFFLYIYSEGVRSDRFVAIHNNNKDESLLVNLRSEQLRKIKTKWLKDDELVLYEINSLVPFEWMDELDEGVTFPSTLPPQFTHHYDNIFGKHNLVSTLRHVELTQLKPRVFLIPSEGATYEVRGTLDGSRVNLISPSRAPYRLLVAIYNRVEDEVLLVPMVPKTEDGPITEHQYETHWSQNKLELYFMKLRSGYTPSNLLDHPSNGLLLTTEHPPLPRILTHYLEGIFGKGLAPHAFEYLELYQGQYRALHIPSMASRRKVSAKYHGSQVSLYSTNPFSGRLVAMYNRDKDELLLVRLPPFTKHQYETTWKEDKIELYYVEHHVWGDKAPPLEWVNKLKRNNIRLTGTTYREEPHPQ